MNEPIKKLKINKIFFEGERDKAYNRVLEIFKSAKKDLIIIDSNADWIILNMLDEVDNNVSITIITEPNNLLVKNDIDNYNKKHHSLTVKYNETFEDVYFIIDNNIVYETGASVNIIGYQVCSINLMSDIKVIDLLINKVNSII